MTKINTYDPDGYNIEILADAFGISEADVVEALFTALKENNIAIEDYL